MSSRQLEDKMEEQQHQEVATVLGISAENLDLLDYDLEQLASEDGHLYGWIIRFGDQSDAEVSSKINGLQGADWMYIDI